MYADLDSGCWFAQVARPPNAYVGPRGSPVRCAPVSISTKRGDDGTTGLFYGGRVRKDSGRIETNGVIDEAQATLGLARAEVRGASSTTSSQAWSGVCGS